MPVRSLLRLLTLLLGIFYLDTVCQTDAEDARAYYARGIQEYVAAPDAVVVAAPTQLPAVSVPRSSGGYCPQVFFWQRRLAARASRGLLPLPPLLRRWLRCGVQQV
ncbi:hypothetical protein [Hymenobacter coccineus]|uniref:Secreted protein n=1 Tax=Hymenobacter coccineus TaxID=1908235 RepID=A0A1G1TL70_9BACT|nr:hypothetical protein [Hymenobacter coccineus]OGX91629.1 hypothetical protein BEN49_04420 [Hymenobacter coccineus]